VDVLALAEGGDERLVAAEVREDPQLDLAVVGGEELPSRLARHEGAADLPPLLRAHGDVLEVRVARAEPSRDRPRLVVARVESTRVRVDELGERVDVGALQLHQRPELEDLRGHRMRRDLLQDALVRRPAGLRLARPPERHGGVVLDLQLLEQDLPELPGRADVEGLAGERVDLLLELADPLAEALRDLAEAALVDADAVPLHVAEHRDERHLDAPEQILEVRLLRESRREQLEEPAGHVGVLARVLGDLLQGNVGHRDLVAPLPDEVRRRDLAQVEVPGAPARRGRGHVCPDPA
jgi:hypothetical protein